MLRHMICLCVGFGLDSLFGDPHFLWHPVQGIGKLVGWLEKGLFAVLRIGQEKEADRGKKRFAGGVLTLLTLLLSVGFGTLLLYAAGRISIWLEMILECIMCGQMLAAKSLRLESMKVYYALEKQDLEQARHAVSMIVGRDTERLGEEGVIRAAVETVAENTSDGVIAPWFYMMLFGPLGGLFYKTVNTMDSMIGYRNDRYFYFGTAAARLDDIVNFIPARLAAVMMMSAAGLSGFDMKNAWRIFKRDRYRHKSPNSAQTESVCAGVLHIRLAGNAYYFGSLVEKPEIGDGDRAAEAEDIRRACRMLKVTAGLAWLISAGCCLLI